jgi:prepilin-type N-terminal cleavage/methylation domain-containing protein
MKIRNQKSGFTLLEIIIVIIIVGVLASLALPRFFSTVEYSKSTEALGAMSAIRQSMERCYLQRSGSYSNCTGFSVLDLEDPANSPNAHFTYALSGQSATGYTITATRNTLDGGSTSSIIAMTQTATAVTRSGVGAFSGIQ